MQPELDWKRHAEAARAAATMSTRRAPSLRALGREAEARRQEMLAQRGLRYADAIDPEIGHDE